MLMSSGTQSVTQEDRSGGVSRSYEARTNFQGDFQYDRVKTVSFSSEIVV